MHDIRSMHAYVCLTTYGSMHAYVCETITTRLNSLCVLSFVSQLYINGGGREY